LLKQGRIVRGMQFFFQIFKEFHSMQNSGLQPKEKTFGIFFSETTKARALKFDMEHYLMNV
jgi:hypothetical protein